MEGLRSCAKNSFQDRWVVFEDEPQHPDSATSENSLGPWSLYETVEMRHGIIGIDEPPFSNRSQQSPKELYDFFSGENFYETSLQLKLIRLQRTYTERPSGAMTISVNITRRLFDRLIDQLEADPWVLWLISNSYDGFHHMAAKDGYADTYFLGLFHGALVWTFIPESAFTKVLFLASPRISWYETFDSLLDQYMPLLATPYVPLLAAVVSIMLQCDEELRYYLGNIIRVERGTGFAEAGMGKSDLKFDVDELATWSRDSADARINIINILRHHEYCMQGLGTIKEMHSSGVWRSLNPRYNKCYDMSITEILESVRVLKLRADAIVSYGTYLKQRAESQINVVG